MNQQSEVKIHFPNVRNLFMPSSLFPTSILDGINKYNVLTSWTKTKTQCRIRPVNHERISLIDANV